MRRLLSVFQVTNTGDNGGTNPAPFAGTGTFRQAIIDSNATPGSNAIDFSIGTGAQTISLSSALPSITVPVTIDGTTQPGYAGNPLIDLDGTSAGAGVNGLDLAAGSDGSTIVALVINNFAGDGITIESTDNAIQGSYIGTNATGTAAGALTMAIGISITAANNTIGGLTATPGTGLGDVISGNTTGIDETGGGSDLIEGNLIGTNAAGTAAVANASDGVNVFGSGNTIGGTVAGAGNVISGNTSDGVKITGSGTTGNVVEGNLIGTDVTGTVAIANGNDGVEIDTGASGNKIGGTAAGQANTIAFNFAGVVVGSAPNDSATGNTIRGNSIYGNTSIGIGLGGLGFVPNDSAGHTGPNLFQDYAEIQSASITTDGDLVIAYSVPAADTAATYPLSIDFYIADSSGTQGQTYLASDTYGAAGSLKYTDLGSAAGLGVSVGTAILATAADAAGNTSEFSPSAKGASSGQFYVVTSTGDSGAGSLRDAVNSSNASLISVVVFDIPTSDPGYNPTTKTFDIQPASALPVLVNPVTIDATSQPGYAGAPLVVLDGTNAGPSADGLDITGGSSTVSGLVIDNFSGGSGIGLSGGGGDLVTACYFGTDPTGTTAASNNNDISIGCSGNTIGGITAAAGTGKGNLISGASLWGVYIIGSGASGNVVEGNLIGTNAAGTGAVGNFTGVNVDTVGIASANTIGGTTAGAGNVISGNLVSGVSLQSTSSNLVAGNLIGTDLSGTSDLRNTDYGVYVQSAGQNTIGGTTAASRNVISGSSMGIWIVGGSATGNLVIGNYIGTDVTGSSAIANAYGVDIASSASGNTVGGSVAGAGNLISGNATDGVEITGSGTTGNLVAGNLIGTNAAGSGAVANGTNGVEIDTSASGNTIGGTTAGARNVISGNAYAGVEINAANDNLVEANFIGTDTTGTVGIANNTQTGALSYVYGDVSINTGASGNTVGGLTATPGRGAGNLLSGNTNLGVVLWVAGPSNLVAGNLIGTDVTGELPLGNGGALGGNGVDVGESPDTIIGEPGGRNVISGWANGIRLLDSGGTTVQANDIGTDITGTAAIPDYYAGVSILVSVASNYTIGGLTSTPGAGPGNVISGNIGGGIGIGYYNAAVADVAIEGNIIGADAAGMHELPNLTAGVELYSVQGVTIGGTAGGAGNLISGDNESGSHGNIWLDGTSSGNLIEGNLIGTDITGEGRLPLLSGDLSGTGVWMSAGASDNTVGGTTAAARNIISGVDGNGIYIDSTAGSGNVVEGNYVGTDETGSVALGSAGAGILIAAAGNVVGGTVAGAGNVISGNTDDGVDISGSGTSGTLVAGNLIGTNAAGTGAIPNGVDGVGIGSSASGNTIGGTTAAARNVISANGGSGVLISVANDNLVEGNYVGTDKTGTVGLGNNTIVESVAYGGISLLNGAAGNTIGGLTATPGLRRGEPRLGQHLRGRGIRLRGIEQFGGRQPDRHRRHRRGSSRKPLRHRGELRRLWRRLLLLARQHRG